MHASVTDREAPSWRVTGRWVALPVLDRVLPDRDYEYGAVFLDTAPDRGGTLKELMGVSGDYFTDVPDELSREEIERAIARLRELARNG